MNHIMEHETGAGGAPVFFMIHAWDYRSPQALAEPMCFHIFLRELLLAILSSTTDSYARHTLMDRSNEQAALTADDLLTLIERHLSELWQAHAHSGNRSLRTVLRSAEALLAERAGMDVAMFRRSRHEHHRKC